MKRKEESGEMLIEASIYFPIVILIVALLICVGMAKLEQSVLLFETEKIASQSVRAAAYAGYEKLDPDQETLEAGISQLPDKNQIEDYYKEKATDLYNFGFKYSKLNSDYEDKLETMVTTYYLLASGILDPECSVSIKGGLVPSAEVKVIYSVHFPKMFSYLVQGGDTFENVKIASRTRKVAINQTEFVRNVDIAFDIFDFIAEKLGIAEDIQNIMDKLTAIKEKLI